MDQDNTVFGNKNHGYLGDHPINRASKPSVEDTNGADGLRVLGLHLDRLSVRVTGEFPFSYRCKLNQLKRESRHQRPERELMPVKMPNGTVMHIDPYSPDYKFKIGDVATKVAWNHGTWTAEFSSGVLGPDVHFAAAIQEKVGMACEALFPDGYDLTPGPCSVSLHYLGRPSCREIDERDVVTRGVNRGYLLQDDAIAGGFYGGAEGADIRVTLFEPTVQRGTSNAKGLQASLEADDVQIAQLCFGPDLARQVARTNVRAAQKNGSNPGLDISLLFKSLVPMALGDGSYPAFFRVTSEEHRSRRACKRVNDPDWERLRQAFLALVVG
jgi:hypothetical protein